MKFDAYLLSNLVYAQGHCDIEQCDEVRVCDCVPLEEMVSHTSYSDHTVSLDSSMSTAGRQDPINFVA